MPAGNRRPPRTTRPSPTPPRPSSWRAPAGNTAWRFLFEPIGEHAHPNAAKPPPSGGNPATAEGALRLWPDAGSTDARAEPIRREWRVVDPRHLLAALARGTVRTAA